MKPRSAKSKGRRLQQWVRVRFLEIFDGILEEGDIRSAIMGEGGVDIKLSPLAKQYIPFDIEAKNQETTSIWAWLKQAEKNAEDGRTPVLVFSRNNSKKYVCLEFDAFIRHWNCKNTVK